MKCGLYDESYKIAADTNLLVNYLYNCHLKVAYLHVDEADENGMESAAIHQGKVYVKLCLECGLGAMVAWSWTELAVYGIKDSPKKESEILIKMFHIIKSLILYF